MLRWFLEWCRGDKLIVEVVSFWKGIKIILKFDREFIFIGIYKVVLLVECIWKLSDYD